jgi:hypothetical protein
LGFLGGDTDQYLAMAESIRKGELLLPLDPLTAHPGLYIRSVGYPAVLAVAQTIDDQDLLLSLRLMHSLLFIVCAMTFVFSLRPYVSPLIPALGLVPSALRLEDFFRSNVAEWTIFCFLLLVLGFGVRTLNRTDTYAPLFLGLSCALATLVKPGFVFLLPMGMVLCLLLGSGRGLVRFLLGAIPLFLWIGLNTYRVGTPTIGLQSSYAAMYIAGAVGPASERESDSPELKRCLQRINSLRVDTPISTFKNSGELNGPGIVNIQGIAAADLARNEGFPWPTISRCFSVYAVRSLSEHPERYLSHLMWGTTIIRLFAVELIILGLLLLLTKHQRPFLLGFSALAIAIHLGHLLVVLLTQVVSTRYYLLSVQPLWIAIFIGLGAWIQRVWMQPNSPTSE